jgi:heme o synthase
MDSLSSSPAATGWSRVATRGSAASLAKALFLLTKPRLASFSILSGMAGYAVAGPGRGWSHAGVAFTGIALSAGGALSLNQWWERKTDALMRRTAGRPLPRGEVGASVALAWSVALSGAGVGVLLVGAGPAAAGLAAATIGIYGLVYTPLKRRTRWATEIGSVSGALPPLLGAAAAGHAWAAPAWVLATVVLFWQMPHFFAVGWMYRDDYRAAGFPLLPAVRGRWRTRRCFARRRSRPGGWVGRDRSSESRRRSAERRCCARAGGFCATRRGATARDGGCFSPPSHICRR